MSIAPTFSLIVPTVGRTSEVGNLFESIVASQFTDLEAIVVDQNQDGSLDDICRRYSRHFPIKHLKVQFKGAARARNQGARVASGTYLNFPDDDCVLLPDTLTLAHELLAGMNLEVLIGMSVDRLGHDSTTAFAHDERFLTLWSMWGRNIEFTMFFARPVFLRVGGYDERFGVGSIYGADEGPELLIRLLPSLPSEGAFYSHRVQFVHEDKAKDFSATGAARAFSYARGRGALVAKWPLPPHLCMALRFVATSVLGSLTFPGKKRRIYWCRLKGFFSGYREYRESLRAERQPTVS